MTDLSEAKRLIEALEAIGRNIPATYMVGPHHINETCLSAATLIAEHEAALAAMRAERRRAVDAEYMLAAVVQMLGPKGREVWQAWEAAGIKRIHTSWGPEAAALTGEEIAQVHLDMDAAVKNAVPCDPDAPNESARALLGEDGR